MNLQHIKYAVEVQKTGSITQAAENLYMGQPNLSKAIRELEKSLGIVIFKRTSKGVLPTAQGEEFLRYAKSILDQVQRIEDLYHSSGERPRFSVSVPRSAYITEAFGRFLSQLDQDRQVDLCFKETNTDETIRDVEKRESGIGIIRCQAIHETYFQNLLADKDLEMRPLWEFNYQVLFSQSHPLANAPFFTPEDLRQYVEILHGDITVPSLSVMGNSQQEDYHAKKKIQIYERGSLFDLLCQLPDSFAWSAPIPRTVLDRYGLAQRSCDVIDLRVKDGLICPKGYCLSPWEKAFVQQLEQVQEEIRRKDGPPHPAGQAF